MELDFLATVMLSSLSSASILLIATIGLAVVFGLMGVINLAHGEFLMIGAYTALTVTQAGVPYLLSIPIAVAVTMAIGALVEVLIISRLYGRIFDTMLATWGISIAFYQLAVLTFGTVSPGIGMPQMPPGSVGYIYLPAFFGIVVMSISMAPVGARLAHKLPVSFDPQQGRIEFPAALALLNANAEGLALQVQADTPEDLQRIRQVVASHFERVAWQTELTLDWQ